MNLNDDFDPARAAASSAANRDDGPELPPLSAEDEARVRAALASLAAAADAGAAGAAGDEFRAALRARFVAGTIEAPKDAVASAATEDTRAASAMRVPVAARRPRVLRPWAAALAAAALLAIVVFAWLPRPEPTRAPAWIVIAATADSTADGASSLSIDGREVALAALATTTLAPGARVDLPAGVSIELRLAGTLGLETAPGTAFTVPTAGATRRATVDHGEVRYVTGPAFAGTRLTVESPEARVEVTGTTFVIISAPQMTCVCVGEGTVHVASRGGGGAAADSTGGPTATHDIAAGKRREFYADGTMSGELPVHAHEAMKLGMLKDRMGAALATPTTPGR